MPEWTFGDVLDALYPGEDPYTLTGGKDASAHRLVRCRDYADCPHRLGEYWTPGLAMAPWMQQLVDQPGRVVSAKQVGAAREQGYACMSHAAYYYEDQSEVLVIEQDTLIVPAKTECRGLQQPGLPLITPEELKRLQPFVVLQAAVMTGLPFAAVVHSGGKSAHIYLRVQGLPPRPPIIPGGRDAPPEAQEVIERRKQAAQDRQQYARWHWLCEGLMLALGTVDASVLHASGRHGNVRTPGGIREDGSAQQILAVGAATTCEALVGWIDAQLSPDAREWWHAQGEHATRVPIGAKNPALNCMLNMRDPGGWKDMLLRRTVQGGHAVDDQALTKQWLSVVAELEPSQRPPEIRRRPNWEQGDWGDIHASFLWWVSALTINELHRAMAAQHPEAPAPMGWFFTGNDWWWEDAGGKEHNLREIWKPGAGGGLRQRLNPPGNQMLAEVWAAQLGEGVDREIQDWWEAGGDGRCSPTVGLVEKVRLPGKNEVIREHKQAERVVLTGTKEEQRQQRLDARLAREAAKKQKDADRQRWEAIAADNATNRRQMFVASFRGPVVYCTEQAPPFPDCWLRFDGKVWQRVSRTIVEGYAQQAFRQFPIVSMKDGTERDPKNDDRNELIKKALFEGDNDIQHDQRWVQKPDAIPFRNGTLYVDAGECEFHPFYWNPDDKAYQLMDYDFDEDIETPMFDLMMNTMFPHEMEREVVLQFMGYLFDPANEYKKFLLLKGHADSGKTTLQEVMTALAGGDEYVTSPSIASMTQDRYWASNMDQARLISIDEQTDTPVQFARGAASLFKQLTGDGSIEVRKMRTDPFKTRIRAKTVVTTNNLPRFSDDSTAFWDRCLYIEPQVPQKKIKGLAVMIAREELPGVAAKAAKALSRLKKQDGFVPTSGMLSRIDDFRESNSPMIEFFNEWMEPVEREYCNVSAVMHALNATKSHGTFQSVSQFVQVLRSTFPGVHISRFTKESMGEKKIHHLNVHSTRRSFWALRGYRCVHTAAEFAEGPQLLEREIQGTTEDHTPIPFPRKGAV